MSLKPLTIKDLKDPKSTKNGSRLPKKPFQLSNPTLGPILLTLCLVGTAFNSLMLLYNSALIAGKNDSDSRAFVQMVDGDAIAIQKVGSLERTPETITQFTEEMMKLCFNWSGAIAGEKDPGAPHRGLKIPSNLSACSWAMHPRFRLNFLDIVVPAMEADKYLGNSTRQSVLAIEKTMPPVERPGSPGIWDVEVISTRMILENGVHTSNDPYNATITIAAVNPPTSPLGEDASIVEKAIAQAQSKGLMIASIKENV